jgi:hypothetical protein
MKRVHNGESGLSVFVKAIAFSPLYVLLLTAPMQLVVSNIAINLGSNALDVLFIPITLYMGARMFLTFLYAKENKKTNIKEYIGMLDWDLKARELDKDEKQALKNINTSLSYISKWEIAFKVAIWFIFVTNIATYGLADKIKEWNSGINDGTGTMFATMFGAIVMIFAYYNLKRLIQWKLEVRRIKAESKKEIADSSNNI